ncbi:MAG: hypothetical protein WCQ49_00940 [Candidatus Saccharibacteria bacterium]
MSYNKKNHTSPDKTNKKIISKKVLIIGLTILLVILGGLFYYFYPILNKKDNTNEPAVSIVELNAEVDNLIENNLPQDAQKVLDDALVKAGDNDSVVKAQIYASKANLAQSAIGGNDFESALKFALEAERLNPTDNSALVVASLEESSGNKVEAIKYYKIYLDRYLKETEGATTDDSDYGYYSEHVNYLESGN